MKSTKRLLILESILLAIAILVFSHVTYAYFTAQSNSSATVTSGNVTILLSEAAVKHDDQGNLVEDTEKTRIFGSSGGTLHEYGIVYPGQTIFKDPTIQNTGSNPAYIAAKVSIKDGSGDIHRVIGLGEYDYIDVTLMLGGGYFDKGGHFGVWNGIENVTYGENFAMVQIPKPAEGRYDLYFFILEPVTTGEKVVLFDQMFFLSEFTNEEMQEFDDLRIDIYGFGVQTFGFESCYEAMINALPEHFSDFPHSAP